MNSLAEKLYTYRSDLRVPAGPGQDQATKPKGDVRVFTSTSVFRFRVFLSGSFCPGLESDLFSWIRIGTKLMIGTYQFMLLPVPTF